VVVFPDSVVVGSNSSLPPITTEEAIGFSKNADTLFIISELVSCLSSEILDSCS
jgi:hypothetical protein